MVAESSAQSSVREDNVVHEVMQLIALAGLSRGGFFEKAAFYCGTCLHLLHGMERFSEDMDFSLLEPDLSFRVEDYFPSVVEEFKMAGKDVEIKMKHKGQPSAIESAFLKESSDVFDISFTTEKRIKVKIEVDINPPPKFRTEMKLVDRPRKFWVRSYDLPGLFAGTVSAALFRKWKTRVKGRDWYDLAWYIEHRVPLDLTHLAERAKESAPEVDVSTREKLIAAFDARIDAIDFEDAKRDVLPYLKDPSELDIWSRAFFKEYVRKISC
jgi:predicted nucleotidyltransferase component of viral defense system